MSRPTIGHRPTAEEIAVARVLLEPWRLLTSPVFHGVEHVPADRPFLLVGNHTLMGVLDVPLMLLGLHERTGLLVRPLGDHIHFQIPVWRDLLARFGTVEGTRENCGALMRARESILVFPGGAREVFKHKGEQYHLIWKNRTGFAALAIAHHYPIVPVAAVGAEECYDILVDSDEMRRSPLGPVLERFTQRVDEFPPVVAGIGPLPRPQRFYFGFGAPIETRKWARRAHDQSACLALRAEVAHAIERGIKTLKQVRRRDPNATLVTRLMRQLVGRTPERRAVARRTRSRRRTPKCG
ncbi:MAG TPA: lysophospholipid acyltransferase family protein [Candidatus Binatia bacterium]|nr:lysophospholipid acyltransferase family protein [Candidatus Binatia bacterium]